MIELVQDAIILRDAPVVIVEPEPETIINVVPEAGAKGDKGDVGPVGEGAEVIKTAGMVIQGHHIVGYPASGLLQHASNDNPDYISTVLGLSLNAALPGDEVTVAINREVEYSGWSWTMGLPIFLGTMGELTQVPPEAPAAVFLIQVGFPTAPDKMWVEVELPIEL